MKRIHTFVLSSILLLTIQVSAQPFPTIQGTTLNEVSETLPDAVRGKRAVIGLAFSLKADEELKKWGQPLYNTLIAGGMGGLMGGNMYNAHVRFVGLLRGVVKLGTGELKKQSAKKIEPKLHPYFLLSESDAKEVMQALNIKSPSEPYFFVVDENGNILFVTSGAYTEKKLNQLTDALLQ